MRGSFWKHLAKTEFLLSRLVLLQIGLCVYDHTLISARKLAEVAGHGISIVWGRGRMLHLNAAQNTLLAGICTHVARLEACSSSSVEKTRVFITLPSTNFRTIWLHNLVTHLQIYLGKFFRISKSPLRASQRRFLWSRLLRPKVIAWMRARNFLKTFGKNRFFHRPLGFAPDWPV